MEPREKAKQLVERFEDVTFKDSYQGEGGTDYFERDLLPEAAKKVALICVDEMLIELTELHRQTPLLYWREVREEIARM